MRRHLAIIAVLVIAVILRTWGITFGLPHTLTRPDEDAVMSIALRFFRRDLDPGFFDWPSLFMYAVSAGFVIYFNLGRLAGLFPYEVSFLSAASANPAPLHLIARGMSAAAGVITVLTVWRIGARIFDATTGLVGAFFLAVAALHVRDSHFGVTDVAATCLLMESFLFTVRAAQTGSRRDLLVSGLWAGLAASTKYNAGLIALPAVLAVASGGVPGLIDLRGRFKWVSLYGGVAALAFVAGTPYAVLDFEPFITALGRIGAHLRDGHTGFAGYGWGVHLSSSLRYGMGLPMLAFGIVGLVRYCAHDRRMGGLFAVFPVVYFALIGSGQTAFARYIIPVVPFLCLAAGYVVVDGSRRLAGYLGRPAHARVLAWALTALIAAPSAWAAVQTDILLSRTDNRLLAADWIHDRFAAGAPMYQSGAVYAAVQMRTADPLAAEHHPVVGFDEKSAAFFGADRSVAVSPELIVVPECPLAYCIVPEPLRAVLARDYRLERTFQAFNPSVPGVVYDLDDAFFVPLAGFGAVNRPGPNLSVYVRRAPLR